ncbi:hypothetical protein Goshw_003564 [Gossypium schwendimanii]|uniref:Uncharacterized protein n=1 Tax=Gossypium schwendimanii TaxID=34291 RepID=A0A7J9NC52_GOSSC|nr:hypothetical protein [Gossypium schwendimanii]
MIKQGIQWRRTSRVRDEKNASKRHKEEIRKEILSIIDEKWKDERPSLKARMSQYGNSPPMVIFEGRTPILIVVINMATVYTNRAIKAYESWRNYKPLVQSNLVTRMESMTTPTYNVYVGWKKGNARDKLLGKIFEGKEIKVNWEIQPVWDDIVVMGRLFPFTRYCGNDTEALYRACNEAAKVLSTC